MNDSFKFPLISITMATYNGEKYLEEQLKSIFQQSYPNIEVIVSDDCSQDKTVEILDRFSKSNNLHYFVNIENLGFVKNFEKVVSLCTGDYNALADQDDIWLPKKLEILKENIGDNTLIFSDALICDENGIVISLSQNNVISKIDEALPSENNKVFTRLLYSNFVTGCTVLMKRDVIKVAHPIPEGIIFHDWWYALCASSIGNIFFYKKSLIYYRQHNRNEVGLLTPHSYINRFFLIFNLKYYKKRKKIFHDQENQLDIFYLSNRFNNEQNNRILDIRLFFKNKQSILFHLQSLFISYKYRKEIYYEDHKYIRYLRCIRSSFF